MHLVLSPIHSIGSQGSALVQGVFKNKVGMPQKVIGKIGKIKNNRKIHDFPDFCLIWEMGGPNYVQKAGFLLTSILPYRILNSEIFFNSIF